MTVVASPRKIPATIESDTIRPFRINTSETELAELRPAGLHRRVYPTRRRSLILHRAYP